MARTASARRDDPYLPFLTAYDPSDLPGTSVDPLGFDRGYTFLGDQILPGLTNVARQPRYFGLLCAGTLLGPESPAPTRTEIQAREQAVLRLERLWALANVLAAPDGESPLGVRGVRYAEAQRDALAREGRRSSGTRFPLLGRQVQYGVLGIYGNVAAGMRLVDRGSLGLSSEYGDRLGAAFLEETGTPKSVREAATDADREVGLDALREWGARSGLAATPGRDERRVLGEALNLDTVRSRMAAALAAHPAKKDEPELSRLARIARKLTREHEDLARAIDVIQEYEACYRAAVLVFERVLWLCGASGSVAVADLAADEVLGVASVELREAVERFETAVSAATGDRFRDGLPRMQDVRAFLSGVRTCAPGCDRIALLVLTRHAEVQHGKFDRGRRKLPWLEAHADRVSLTLARSSEVRGEPKTTSDIRPHEYRTAAADALIAAAEVAP
jgi:hypothetical protein